MKMRVIFTHKDTSLGAITNRCEQSTAQHKLRGHLVDMCGSSSGDIDHMNKIDCDTV